MSRLRRVDLGSGPEAEAKSPGGGKERHGTRNRGDDGGRGTETGHSGPISYSGAALLLLNARAQRKRKSSEAKGKRSSCIITNSNYGEERKQKLLFTEDVFKQPHTQNRKNL